MKKLLYSYGQHNFIKFLIVFFVLLAIHFFIFINHYINDFGFPWDFLETYFAVPYYWIELSRMNIETSWVPFQGMGYPLYMNLQSGYYYPLNWFFVIFDIPYTIHGAVLLNIFHIFFGSLGILYVSRMLEMSWGESLLAALLYLTYGSFYGNSGHIDIIRAYSITPWLIAPLITKWNLQSKPFLISIFLLPFFVYFFWTGGYIGIVLSTFFVLFLVLLIRAFVEKEKIIIALYIFSSLAIGFLLASVFLIPSFLDSAELIRSNVKVSYDYMKVIDFFSLVYPVENSALSHDITMRSISVGFLGLSLFTISLTKLNKLNGYLFFIMFVSILMATGIMHKYIIILFPQLGLSRFPFADYKGLLGVSFILTSVGSLQYIKNIKFIYLFLALCLIIVFGNYYLNYSYSNNFSLWRLIVSLAMVVFSLYIYQYKRYIGIVFLVGSCLFDFFRIHDNARYWNFKDATKYIELAHGISLDNNTILINKILNDSNREGRKDELSHPYKYSGYFNGSYMMNDYGGSMHLQKYADIRNNEIFKSFALMPWTPIPGDIESIKKENIEQKMLFVQLEKYKTSQIIYSINSKEATSFIENEIFWKGWGGTIVDKDQKVVQEIKPSNIDGFRKWDIPAGEYKLIAYFTPAYQKVSTCLSIIGVLFWLFFIFYIRSGRKNYDNIARI